jgi:hypothetical protein
MSNEKKRFPEPTHPSPINNAYWCTESGEWKPIRTSEQIDSDMTKALLKIYEWHASKRKK